MAGDAAHDRCGREVEDVRLWFEEGKVVKASATVREVPPSITLSWPALGGETDEKIHSIIGFINGKRCIQEIMDASGISDNETLAIFSMLDRYKWVTVTKQLGPKTSLVKLVDPPMFLKGVYGEHLDKIVNLFDGRKTLGEVCEIMNFSMEVIRTLAKNLINAGVLDYHE